MKKIAAFLLFASTTLLAVAQNNFEVMNKKPVAGSVLTIEYMPRNTALQGHNDFEAIAYLLEGAMPQAKEVVLKQQGGLFRGTVKTNDSTRAVFFTFAKDELRDNHNDDGYYTVLYNKKGDVMPGANLALAQVFSSYGSIWNLKMNREKATTFSKTEFANPMAKTKFRTEYLDYLGQSGNEEDKALLKEELDKMVSGKKAGEVELMNVNGMYQRYLKDKEKGNEITAQIKERFPNGAWRRREVSEEFRKAKTLAEKEKAFAAWTAMGPVKKEEQSMMEYLAGQLARSYADSGNYTAMKSYLAQLKDPISKANMLNSIAWKMSGEGISKTPGNVPVGLELSAESLALVKKEMQEMKNKYPYYSQKQYVQNLKNSYYMFADTYAVLLYHHGDYDKAYTLSKEAVEHSKRKDVSLNENFAALVEKTKGKDAALAELAAFVEEGKVSPAMKEQLKTLYQGKGNATEAQWNAYVSNLEERAFNKLKAELVKKMINQPAPQFALKDISGKQVALSSLKGKVVVVDFWATWCGPCIASFPGMQKAVNKFKDNDDVVFLFIDTWENDSNRVQKVTDFIAKNKYSFTVLYDEPGPKGGNDFAVIGNYNVEGIPTKFVIDRNNNIRFKSVGYNGSPDATFNEVTAMIDLAAAESGQPIKKAF